MSNDSERTYGAAAEIPPPGPAGDPYPAEPGNGPLPFGITVRFPPMTDVATRLVVLMVLRDFHASDVCEYQSSEVLPALVTATVDAAVLHAVLAALPPRLFVHYGMQEFRR